MPAITSHDQQGRTMNHTTPIANDALADVFAEIEAASKIHALTSRPTPPPRPYVPREQRPRVQLVPQGRPYEVPEQPYWEPMQTFF